jgi:hypothetical protein
MSKLELEPNTSEIFDLRKAAKKLSKEYYLRYKTFQVRTSEYGKICLPIPGGDDV